MSGGHSINDVLAECNGKPEIIQQITIISAAYIDTYVPVKILTRSYYVQYCMDQLHQRMAEELAIDIIMEPFDEIIGAVPYVNVITYLTEIGVNIYDAIALANEYDKCCQKFIH